MTQPGRTHSVLVVEDERIVAKDLQQVLRGMGYDAYAIAASAEEALARASEKCPDLVLMDIRIKGERDGIETAALLRDRFGVPVIYLTAHADEATLERAKQTEPYGYLMKPINSSELRSSIEVSLHRHQLEKRMRERERWFSTTLRTIGDAVVAVDLAGNVSFMNASAESLTGIPAAQAIGQPARDIVRMLDPSLPQSPVDGEHRVVSDSATPVVDAGQTIGAVMVFRDLTEQKLLQKQLELADRLSSLGTMAAGVAHEVNNPLAVVLANASYVLDELRSQHDGDVIQGNRLAEVIQAQSDLESASRRIARIVGDLQAFSRPAPQAAGEADVASAVAWAVRATAHEFKYRARVATELAAVPRALLDETRLGQILVNLLMNAAHAVAPGQYDVNTVTVAARSDGDRVVIEVRDTGCGMPREVLDRAFEPFYTTKASGVGTGLGLAICHGIATSVGGRIEADSEVGVGTTFRVILPAVVAPAPAPEPAVPAVPKARRARILAIDDEPMVLQALRRTLSEHDVVRVEDARAGLEMIVRGDRFDLIFSDVMMPHMNGMEFYERLLAERPEYAERVVFLSGGTASPRVADFLSVIPNPNLEKPIVVETLRRFVRDWLAQCDTTTS